MRADQETLDLLPVDLLRIVRDLELGEMARAKDPDVSGRDPGPSLAGRQAALHPRGRLRLPVRPRAERGPADRDPALDDLGRLFPMGGSDTWIVTAAPHDGQVRATVETMTQTHSGSARRETPQVFELFWSRMDYMLTGCGMTLAEIRQAQPVRTGTVGGAYLPLATCVLDGLESDKITAGYLYRLVNRGQEATVTGNFMGRPFGSAPMHLLDLTFRQAGAAVQVESRRHRGDGLQLRGAGDARAGGVGDHRALCRAAGHGA